MDVGAGVAASVLGIPAVPYAIALTHMGFAMIHPAAMSYRRDLWTSRGQQPPDGDPLLGQALLDPTPPSLRRFSGPLDIPKIPIRPVGYAESIGQLPAWLEAPRTRPRVYLTLGTVSFGAVEVLSRAISEISDLDVDLLVAVGPEGDPALLGEVGDNVHLERFVDQSQVLPQIDLIVHHGGTGSVLGALAAGLPQLIMPQGADQFFNAEYLTEAGAARALRNEEQDAGHHPSRRRRPAGPRRRRTRRRPADPGRDRRPAVPRGGDSRAGQPGESLAGGRTADGCAR